MPDEPQPVAPRDALAWEAEHRRPAAWGAFFAAVLTIIGAVVSALAQGAVPKFEDRVVTEVDALRIAAEGRPVPGGRLAAVADYLGHHPLPFIIGAVIVGVGVVLTFLPLGFLFKATRARRARLPQLSIVAAAVGAVGYGIGQTVALVSYYAGAASFTGAADRSNSAAADALNNSGVVVGSIVGQLGRLSLALALVLIPLNAMRAGLLTRFMGILGVIVGATLVLPLDQFGIIRAFWVGALGLLILGRWPSGLPRAWVTGEAVPWPSQQELREQRQAAARRARGGRGGRREPAGGPDGAKGAPAERDRERERRRESVPPARAPAPRRPEPGGAQPHSSSKKRKRKRRS